MTGKDKPQLRTDPLSGLKVLLAPERSKRPLDLKQTETDDEPGERCPFCEGNERQTPLEIAANRPNGGEANTGGWSTRVVPNKYPLLEDQGGSRYKDPLDTVTDLSGMDLFKTDDAIGSHELIVHTPRHKFSMADLTDEELRASLDMWSERIRAHSAASYVHLFVNEGAEAGASRAHTHAQLLALPFVPQSVDRERERFNAFYEQSQGSCLLCDLVEEEVRLKERFIAENGDAVILAPFASRLPYQLQIVPRAHSAHFSDNGEQATEMLELALNLLVERFDGIPPLNMWVRTAPKDAEHFHWHIEIVPRLSVLAGVELGVDVAVGTVSPEYVASALR